MNSTNIKNSLIAKLGGERHVEFSLPVASNEPNVSAESAAGGAGKIGENAFYGQLLQHDLLNSVSSAAPVAVTDEPYPGDADAYDGYIIGADGEMYSPETPLAEIAPETELPRSEMPASEDAAEPEATAVALPPAAETAEPTPISTEAAETPEASESNETAAAPTGTPEPITAAPTDPGETIIVVNGINTSPEQAAENVRLIAEETGGNVYGVYNATEGIFGDVLQWGDDYLNDGNNPAAATVTDLLYVEITAGRPVTIIAHSQGAPITADALTDLRGQLIREGYTPAEVDEMLSLITVETYGGATEDYPPGPNYVHYVNVGDPVANTVGLGDAGGVDRIRIDDLPPNSTVYGWNDNGGRDPLDEHSFGAYVEARRDIFEGETSEVTVQESGGDSSEARERKLNIDGAALVAEFTVTDADGNSYIDWTAADAYLERVAETDPEYAAELRQYLLENQPAPKPEPLPEA